MHYVIYLREHTYCVVAFVRLVYVMLFTYKHYVICRLAQVQCAHVCIDDIRIPSVADIYFET